MRNLSTRGERRPYLIISLIVNLGILFIFKYFNFFYKSLLDIVTYNNHKDVEGLSILLPIGISFYTFQTLAYTIEVYRGNQKPEEHLGIFALYVSFFPQLVAGPIERAKNLIPQFYKKHKFDYYRIIDGLKLMLWGYFKKIVIADRLAVYISEAFENPQSYSSGALFLANYFVLMMIYCDFSGYTDIARGAARILGYNLMENFRQPIFAASISEFWRRWHISMSTWFRDYLYLPLLRRKNHTKIERHFYLVILFFIIGLWHGANWTFILWGMLNGLYLLFGNVTRNYRNKMWIILDKITNKIFSNLTNNYIKIKFNFKKMRKIISIIITFNLICILLPLFICDSISAAWNVYRYMFALVPIKPVKLLPINMYEIFIAFCSLFLLLIVDNIESKINIRRYINGKPLWLRWMIYYAIIIAALIFGEYNLNEFVYFQF